VPGITGIQVDKRRNIFPVYSIRRQRKHRERNLEGVSQSGIEGGMLSSKKRNAEMKACRAGKPVPKAERREDRCGNRIHIHVEMVTEEVAFPMGVSTPVAVWLRVMAFAVTGRTAFVLAMAEPLFSLLCSGADRSSITSKSQMLPIDQSLADGTI